MPIITSNTRLQRDQSTLSVDLNGETVMLSETSAEYIKLDAIGGHIWECLAEPQTVSGLVAEMVAHYQGDPAVIEADVLEFLETFKAKGLLKEAP